MDRLIVFFKIDVNFLLSLERYKKRRKKLKKTILERQREDEKQGRDTKRGSHKERGRSQDEKGESLKNDEYDPKK